MDLGALISEFGFPVVMTVGLGYFIYFIWNFIGEHIDPALEEMHFALIRVIDRSGYDTFTTESKRSVRI